MSDFLLNIPLFKLGFCYFDVLKFLTAGLLCTCIVYSLTVAYVSLLSS